jgi:hypothetical protein
VWNTIEEVNEDIDGGMKDLLELQLNGFDLVKQRVCARCLFLNRALNLLEWWRLPYSCWTVTDKKLGRQISFSLRTLQAF